MILIIPFQNMWLVGASFTEWTCGNDCSFSMHNEAFFAFMMFNIFIALWQTSSLFTSFGSDKFNQQRKGIWFEIPVINALVTISSYTVLIVGFGLDFLLIS